MDLRTGWFGNQQLSFSQPGRDRQGVKEDEGPPCPELPSLTGGRGGTSRPLTPPAAQLRSQQGHIRSKATSASHIRNISEMEKYKF